jgi:hypothetical protein
MAAPSKDCIIYSVAPDGKAGLENIQSEKRGAERSFSATRDPDGVPGPPPVGQVLIQFAEPVANACYSVLVSPRRAVDAPLIAANYGDVQTTGFVVVLFNPVAPREYQTVRNGDFSFIVMS